MLRGCIGRKAPTGSQRFLFLQLGVQHKKSFLPRWSRSSCRRRESAQRDLPQQLSLRVVSQPVTMTASTVTSVPTHSDKVMRAIDWIRRYSSAMLAAPMTVTTTMTPVRVSPFHM